LGSDFDGGGGLPGLADVSQTANITRELVKRDYSDKNIFKILGANNIRVFETVFK
jgi:membrane dipeptidase